MFGASGLMLHLAFKIAFCGLVGFQYEVAVLYYKYRQRNRMKAKKKTVYEQPCPLFECLIG